MTQVLFGSPVPRKYVRKAEKLTARLQRKYGFDAAARYPLTTQPAPVLGERLGVLQLVAASDQPATAIDPATALVVGTIRMGYGHYRIAMAIASAARARGRTPLWLDLLAFDSPTSRMIRDLDYWYSLGSRVSQRSRLFNRVVWEPLMGKAYRRAEKNYPVMRAARLFAELYRELPRTIPFVGTHPWTALAALEARMISVVNVVPDNCPLGFHLAPGARHAVQSPHAYSGFRAMKGLGPASGAPAALPGRELRCTGHYIDHELVVNLPQDCAARIERLHTGAPRRILMSLGGAGAQQGLYMDIVRHLLPAVRQGRIVLWLNFGDHEDARDRFVQQVEGFAGLAQWHASIEDAEHLAEAADAAGLHAFLQPEPFAAVYTTNVLMRACDLLLTKPSELAFYPVPKLLLPRVGGHEAWGAIRSAELGDGTPECESLPETLHMLDILTREPDLAELYCRQILVMHQQGVYDGAYNVVDWASEHLNEGL